MPTGKVSITQLTPLLFLERSADVFPQRVAIVYGDRRLDLCRIRRECPAARQRAARIRDRARRPRRLPASEHPGDARRPLRRAARSTPFSSRSTPVSPAPRSRPSSVTRVRGSWSRTRSSSRRSALDPSSCPDLEEVVAVDDVGAGRPVRDDAVRRAARASRRLGRAVARRRRGARDLHQLHVRDDRQPEGRDVHASWRLSQRPGRGRPLAARHRLRLPVDAADVPLQRLVHDLGRHRDRRAPRLPSRRRPGSDLEARRRRGRHPLQRRPDRAHVACQPPRRPMPSSAP